MVTWMKDIRKNITGPNRTQNRGNELLTKTVIAAIGEAYKGNVPIIKTPQISENGDLCVHTITTPWEGVPTLEDVKTPGRILADWNVCWELNPEGVPLPDALREPSIRHANTFLNRTPEDGLYLVQKVLIPKRIPSDSVFCLYNEIDAIQNSKYPFALPESKYSSGIPTDKYPDFGDQLAKSRDAWGDVFNSEFQRMLRGEDVWLRTASARETQLCIPPHSNQMVLNLRQTRSIPVTSYSIWPNKITDTDLNREGIAKVVLYFTNKSPWC